jgi:hypothetical protein
MFDVGSRPMLYVFAVEPHCAMTILTTKLSHAVADRIHDSHRDPFSPLFAAAHEQFLDLAVVNPFVCF